MPLGIPRCDVEVIETLRNSMPRRVVFSIDVNSLHGGLSLVWLLAPRFEGGKKHYAPALSSWILVTGTKFLISHSVNYFFFPVTVIIRIQELRAGIQ